MSNKFWDKVMKCKHNNLSPVYLNIYGCGTPYCYADEIYCLDCRVFITKCGCGYSNGMSGWPESRWKKYWRGRYKRR